MVSSLDKRSVKFVLKQLKDRGLTLGVAESCTGGLISKIITDSPGSSDVFKGGIVSYTNKVKENNLEISGDKLKKYGEKDDTCPKCDQYPYSDTDKHCPVCFDEIKQTKE